MSVSGRWVLWFLILYNDVDIFKQEAQRARAEGIEMIAFGVNDGTFINELQGITGNLPDALFLFTDTDFADDEKLKLNLESAANFICNSKYLVFEPCHEKKPVFWIYDQVGLKLYLSIF